jgi:integrase
MHGCGLRIGEVLAVRRGDFISTGQLRVSRQVLADGRTTAPLKHRGEDDYRDVPVPEYAFPVNAYPFLELPIFAPVSHAAYRKWFARAAKAADLPESFTPHSLRHVFASNALAQGIPITDVSKWLGHKNIQVTYGIYGHLVRDSLDRGAKALDAAWEAC